MFMDKFQKITNKVKNLKIKNTSTQRHFFTHTKNKLKKIKIELFLKNKKIEELKNKIDSLKKELEYHRKLTDEKIEFISDKTINKRLDKDFHPHFEKIKLIYDFFQNPKYIDDVRDLIVIEKEKFNKEINGKFKHITSDYYDLLYEHIRNMDINNDIYAYHRKQMIKVFENFGNNELKTFIKSVYNKTINNINCELSKTTINQMSDMNVTQNYILSKGFKELNKKIEKLIPIENDKNNVVRLLDG